MADTMDLEEKRAAFNKRFPNPPHVMVCCPTLCASAEHATVVFPALNAQIYPNFSVVFIDTNPAAAGTAYAALPGLIQRFLLDKRTTILSTSTPTGANPKQIVSEAREQLRQHFLASDATHLFFLDDDVVLPPTAVAMLFAHQKPSMVGVYLNPMSLREGHKGEVVPCVFIELPQETGPSRVRIVQIIEVMPPTVFPIGISGFGCSLFSREVMAGTAFVFDPASPATEDSPFFLDLARRGIPSFCDTRVKCRHLKFPLGDERNNMLDFDHYQLRYVA